MRTKHEEVLLYVSGLSLSTRKDIRTSFLLYTKQIKQMGVKAEIQLVTNLFSITRGRIFSASMCVNLE